MLTSEYTTPLSGVPYYRSVGIIKAIDRVQNQYNVGEVAYERYDDQNFQYVFTPYWKLIEYLPEDIFGGIPGIDMSIPKDTYYRVNMTPSFVSKRTPSPSRENIKELLEEVGLDYYDRFEWLLRSDRRCGDDNLIVVRKRESVKVFDGVNSNTINELQPGDNVVLNSLSEICEGHREMTKPLFRVLQSGATIHVKGDNASFSIENCNSLYILERMMAYDKKYRAICQKAGIEKAKNEGKYKGRKRIDVDMMLFAEVADKFEKGLLVEQQALETMGMSRSTFYRRLREWKKRI